MNHLSGGFKYAIQMAFTVLCIVDAIGREREDTGHGADYPSGFVKLLTRHRDALEEVIL